MLRWLRDYNAGRADQVRFFGVEYYFTRLARLRRCRRLRRGVAPDRLDRAARAPGRDPPFTDDKFAYVQWYMAVADKEPYIGHAHAVLDLVEDVARSPTGPRVRSPSTTLARSCRSTSTTTCRPTTPTCIREERAAENLRWWQRAHRRQGRLLGGQPAHRQRPRPADRPAGRPGAALPERRVTPAGVVRPGVPVDRLHLRPWHGEPRPRQRRRRCRLLTRRGSSTRSASVGFDQFALDLRGRRPRPVQRWLHGPITTRGLADSAPTAS